MILILSGCGEAAFVGPGQLDVTTELQLSPEPILLLGVVEGDSSQVFDAINGVMFVGDDRIAVGDRSRTIRFFSLDGMLLETAGGPGQGPDEFRYIGQLLRAPGGGVLAYDTGNRTVKRFDSSGRFIESNQIRGRDFSPATGTGLAWVGEGEFVAIGFFTKEVVPGVVYMRDTVPVFLFEEFGGRQDSIGAVPASAPSLSVGDGTFWNQPMAPRTSIAGWEGIFAVTVGDEPDIRLFDLSGRPVDAFSTVRSRVEVTPSIRRSFVAEYREWRALIGMPESLPLPEIWEGNYPDELPYYNDLLWGGACLWIQHFPVPGGDTQVWDVVRPGTDYAGRLEMPSSYRVWATRGPLIAATVRDELGVQRVLILKVENMIRDCVELDSE